jgi:putative transposase
VKYAWIDTHRDEFELAPMCDALTVSMSGYRAWKGGGSPTRTRLTDAQMLALIQAIHQELKGAYGSPAHGARTARPGIPGQQGTRRAADAGERHPGAPQAAVQGHDRLEALAAGGAEPAGQGLHAGAPNQVWTADMTYIWTDEGWLYLAVVLDLFNREVVGWSIKPRMTADIVIDALTMAWFRKKPAPGLIHHSDRGSQYASHAFQARLEEYGMICSMSRKGNCWDNAPTESFFNSLKNERVHGTRYSTRAAAEADLFDYIEPFYNRRRQHSTLGYASPMKFLEDWISTQHEQQLAA